ncbi:hypothetical protein F5X68DRAFT_241474 [Plectosphaerella plurivora]|uniref:Uncharacterized protein n=1 Tax=Plectosphaerella plurivora TaxID=936078 RepID=A0A9P9A9N0_9PEZI|nr:hypothetical protein F5X68DRAFT_241474 [Plectosphaerella plurivora]
MTILILKPDANGHARASIHESAAVYAKISRRLEKISHEVEMPLLVNPEEDPLSCREPAEETAEINAHFSAQIHAFSSSRSLLPIMRGLAAIDDEKGAEVVITFGCQSFTSFPYCQHRIYHARRLPLQDPEMLTELPFVRKLRIGIGKYGPYRDFHFSRVRPISLCVPVECLVRLTGVTELDCPWLWEWLPVAAAGPPIRHFTRVWEGPWRDARHDFGAAMEKREGLPGLRLPATLTKARLWFTKPMPVWEKDQGIPMPDLTEAGISSALEAEDPHPKGFAISNEHYPPLQTTAEDEEVDEQYDEDPQGGEEVDWFPDVFRTEPVPEKVEPLLAAFATAVNHMGAIEDAELFAYLAWYPSERRAEWYRDEALCDSEKSVHRWGVRFLVGDKGRAQGVVQWHVGDWRPSRSVMSLFEDLGRQEWLEFKYEAWTNTQYRRLGY